MLKHDIHWMGHAKLAAKRACCATSRQVGAVIVSPYGRLLSMGFNGVPSKIPHPTICKRQELGLKSGEQPHLCGCIHAEANAIINAAREGVKILNATIYCTTQPCLTCCGMIINSGIKRIVFDEEYAQEQAQFESFLATANVEWEQIRLKAWEKSP